MDEFVDRLFDPKAPPVVVAELSANHLGSFERAKQLIQEAKKAGADAVKLQTYTPASMTLRSKREEFQIKGGLWDGYSLWDLYEIAQTPYEWHAPLFAYAKSLGITCFSTPFDPEGVALLESLKTPIYKIASFELNDFLLIETIAKTQKPLILSTGMATLSEVKESVEFARACGIHQIVLLHCVSGYPTPLHQANLRSILALNQHFSTPVGLSDHTLEIDAAMLSVALGGKMIEKHLTLNRADGGPDSAFSLEPDEFSKLVASVKRAHLALGVEEVKCLDSEKTSTQFRRSLIATQEINEGEEFTENNVRALRPGFGISPAYYKELLNKKALERIERGVPIQFKHFKK